MVNRGLVRLGVLSCSALVAACSGDAPPAGPPSGPPGGVLTVPDGAFAGGSPGALGGFGNFGGGGASHGAGGSPVFASGGTESGGASAGGAFGAGGFIGSSGGAAPVAHCAGSPTPCSLLGSATCETVTGCSTGGVCDGYVEYCSSQFYSSSCYRIQGCVWSSYSNYCSGIAWSCDLFDGPATCGGQPGCSWTSTCEGTPTPCSLLSESNCASVPGCHLEYL
ncbi:MAG TPA: hypothetical protein VHE30_29800 [Polyangiaceae bacterium]|nr:hypothetical protein [Polyangiaceae bacterium]